MATTTHRSYSRSRSRFAVVPSPAVYTSMRLGVDLFARAIRPTLGPAGRNVAIASSSSSRRVELLDDGGVIARRIIEISDPDADMAGMVLRHALWRVHERVGDGTATTAVLFQAMIHEGLRQLAANVNAMDLRGGMECAVDEAVEALRRRARPLEGRAEIARFALSVCHDPAMAELLGEIFDIVGPSGHVLVEEMPRCGLDREYVEGSYWKGSRLSRYMVDGSPYKESSVDNAAVIIADLAITKAGEMVTLLELLKREGAKALFLVAREISDAALGVLVANSSAGVLKSLAVRLQVGGDDLLGAVEDMAVLAGAKPLTEMAGDHVSALTSSHIGMARRAWATNDYVGLVGGAGNPLVLRQHIATLRQRLKDTGDSRERASLQMRVARLFGGTATLLIGGFTPIEVETRKAVAQRAVAAVRLALSEGVVPGGGSALVHVARELTALSTATKQAPGFGTVICALCEPLRAIASNAGYEPGVIAEKVHVSPTGYGWDALSGNIVDMWRSGILDPLPQLEVALRTAVSSAAALLTADVFVHRARPEIASEP